METLTWLFGISLFIVFYSYLGYGMVLGLLVRFKKQPGFDEVLFEEDLPDVAVVVAAFNEQKSILEKIRNCQQLDYPKEKLHLYFVTDGSSDDTPQLVAMFPEIHLFHDEQYSGRLASIDRVMTAVKEPITLFTDATALLNREAVLEIIPHFANNLVGAVAGEKTILEHPSNDPTSSGEGLYWKYESMLKQWDYHLHSVVGAAGELFAIRTMLYESPKSDTLIEDFIMTLSIAEKGYRVAYEPAAKAYEATTDSLQEELNRKVRISAGGLQAVWRKRALLNPFRYGILTFQYFSHRVLRWTMAPLALLTLFLSNLFLEKTGDPIYVGFFILQIAFYALALLGYYLDSFKIRLKGLFIPLYFTFMNLSVYLGLFKLLSGHQPVLWEKAKRK